MGNEKSFSNEIFNPNNEFVQSSAMMHIQYDPTTTVIVNLIFLGNTPTPDLTHHVG